MTPSSPAMVGPAPEAVAYESLVHDALHELEAAESEDILEPVGSGDEGPLMAWFVAS